MSVVFILFFVKVILCERIFNGGDIVATNTSNLIDTFNKVPVNVAMLNERLKFIKSELANITEEVSTDVEEGDIPESFDWRQQNMVTPVKDEGKCGAGWAFAAIATIESHRLIQLSKNETLSEQFLLDCDMEEKNCSYSSMVNTFTNIVKIGGVPLYSNYRPYMARKLPCVWPLHEFATKSSNDTNNVTKKYDLVDVLGFRRVPPDEDVMKQFLFSNGPLAAAINSESMIHYKGGIDMPTVEHCNSKNLNHTVLLVGYNSATDANNKTTPFWIIKNSWGTEWGEAGYYRLARGTNACGIASQVSFVYFK